MNEIKNYDLLTNQKRNSFLYGKIYKLYVGNYFYIGSTYKTSILYLFMKVNSGQKIKIELIINYPCKNKDELTKKENEFIKENINNNLCLNSMQSYSENREKRRIKYIKEVVKQCLKDIVIKISL